MVPQPAVLGQACCLVGTERTEPACRGSLLPAGAEASHSVLVLLCKVLPSDKAERGCRAEKFLFCPSVGGLIGQHHRMSIDRPCFKVYQTGGVLWSSFLPSGCSFFPRDLDLLGDFLLYLFIYFCNYCVCDDCCLLIALELSGSTETLWHVSETPRCSCALGGDRSSCVGGT